MSVVVVGTDTGVGKTLVSCIVLLRYGRSRRLAYWKPVASGAVDGPTDREIVARWVGRRSATLEESYLLGAPLSPHLAARLEGVSIDPEKILHDLVRHATEDARRTLVIEGVGGLHVPLTDSGYLLTHLLADLHLPCLLVARSTLGTINHTLLSVEALRTRRIEIAGVVLSGPESPENRRAIERFGAVEVIAEIGIVRRPGRRSLATAAARFDRRGKLRKYFD